MVKVRLLKQFKIVLDGEVYPKQFCKEDIVILNEKTANDLIAINGAEKIDNGIKEKQNKVINIDYEKKVIEPIVEKKRRGRPKVK